MTPEAAIIREFSAYYDGEEMQRFLHSGLEDQADRSASRLARELDRSGGQATQLLRALANDRDHPLIGTIEDETSYGWRDTEDDWLLFRHLVRRIADGIEA